MSYAQREASLGHSSGLNKHATRRRGAICQAVEALEARQLLSATVTSVTLNGGAHVVVAPGDTISAAASVTTSGHKSDARWDSTKWMIGTSTTGGTWTLVNTADHNSKGTYKEKFNITAPTAEGVYNIYSIAYADNAGTQKPSATYVLAGSIIVDASAPTVSVTSPAAGQVYGTDWSGKFQGECGDSLGVDKVEASVQRDADGAYWNGTSFSSSTQQFQRYDVIAAPTYVGRTVNKSTTGRSSAVFAHTVPQGDNRLLVVSVLVNGDKRATSVTYAGQSLTQAASTAYAGGGGQHVEQWYLVAPPVGTANVVVGFSASVDPSAVVASNFAGVNQSAPVGAKAMATSGTSVSATVATQYGNSLVFGALDARGANSGPFAPGTGVTELWDTTTGTSNKSDAGVWGGCLSALVPGSYKVSATLTTSKPWAMAAIEIKGLAPTTWSYTFPMANFAADGGYTVCAKVTDDAGKTTSQTTHFVINATGPTDPALSNATVKENEPAGTVVGTLSTTKADPSETLTYTLVDGDGAVDNAAFSIVGNQLQTNQSFDYEARSQYSIRVRVSDQYGLVTESAIGIAVTNVNESPTELALNGTSVAEQVESGTLVGVLSAADPDAGGSFTYQLVDGAGGEQNAEFAIVGDALVTATKLDYEQQTQCSIRVRVTDQDGASYEKSLTVGVVDVYEPLVINGTPGNDRIVVKMNGDLVVVRVNGRVTRTPLAAVDSVRVVAGAGDDYVMVNPGVMGVVLCGGAGNDTLTGGNGNDIVKGGIGDDLLNGGAGSDRLVAGAGADVMYGGNGADLLIARDGLSNDTLYGGRGHDRAMIDNTSDEVFGIEEILA